MQWANNCCECSDIYHTTLNVISVRLRRRYSAVIMLRTSGLLQNPPQKKMRLMPWTVLTSDTHWTKSSTKLFSNDRAMSSRLNLPAITTTHNHRQQLYVPSYKLYFKNKTWFELQIWFQAMLRLTLIISVENSVLEETIGFHRIKEGIIA